MQDRISNLDHSNVLGSITSLSQQISHTIDSMVPESYPDLSSDITNIIFVGMGGSALGARVIGSLLAQQLPLPFNIINNYHLPDYANQTTLVILSSYSGTTEEVISCMNQAIAQNCHIACIAAGGTLLDNARTHQWPHYQIDPQFNPSNQPRMAIGYAITSTLLLLHYLHLIPLKLDELTHAIDLLNTNNELYAPKHPNNFAITTATQLQSHVINLISTDHLVGATHVTNNQLNENAKHLTAEFVVPELNHHYLEALSYPQSAPTSQAYLLIKSDQYHPQNAQRLEITRQILSEKGFLTEVFHAQGPTPLCQVFEVIQFGAYLNFYLAMLHGIDPAPIPTVDYFKTELKKNS